MAEAIVVARAARARHEEPDGLGRSRGDALRAQERREAVPSGRRISDAERLERLARRFPCQPALVELLERIRAVLVRPKLLLEERRGECVHGVEVVALALV